MITLIRLSLAVLLFIVSAQNRILAQVTISEFMASNGDTLADEDGEFPDWIELRNNGGTTVNLDGFFLTDAPSEPSTWRLPALILNPGTYAVVFASGKDRRDPARRLHTNFSLPAEGGYLGLVDRDGRTVVSEFAGFPKQYRDVAYGRLGSVTSGSVVGFLNSPTPGSSNSEGFVEFVKDTRFSHDRGFFDQAFDLGIWTETPNATIRYTLDGTIPSLTNGVIYSQPIRIASTSTVRAVAIKAGARSSDVDTHTYIFPADVITQAANGKAPPGWPATWGNNTTDYGMDPDIVNDPTYAKSLASDLRSIPTFSVVMNLADLFDRSRGIYANPGQDGREWERPCSVELIQTNGATAFQVNAGLRIRGGFSRSTGNPKHAFRLFFREDYGDPRLNYPMFGKDGTDSFNALDLRTFQNYSWSFQGDSRGVFIRDQFSRDTQLEMGQQGERGNYYHLYVNGLYWGLYNTCERPEASYGETYFGGKAENYDVVKVEAGSYNINATDGNMDAWTRLWNQARAGLSTDAAYFKIQGRNPDGTVNPELENLLDVPNMIDYMLVILYGGNLDAPISNFLGNSSPNNFYGMRDRAGTNGFRFFAHDAEHTLLNVNEDRTGPYSAGTTLLKSNPQWFWQQCQANAEFRLRVADHIQRHFFNGGALTPEACSNRFQARMREIDRAVVCESARWGDAKVARPYTRATWLSACNTVLSGFISRRSGVVLNQLKADKLYSALAAPILSQHGGTLAAGAQFQVVPQGGTAYYTLDGSDPRVIGGGVSTRAKVYESSIALTTNATLKTRSFDGTTWSALVEAEFTVVRDVASLRLTEVMYNPSPTDNTDGQELEFIEFKNVGGSEIDLTGVTFTQGIDFAFGLGSKLSPGAYAVLVRDPAAFAKRYPGVAISGVYQGQLSNAGEKLSLTNPAGEVLFVLDYDDSLPWPQAADGSGFSLVRHYLRSSEDPSNPSLWRASSLVGGSPGRDDLSPLIPHVVINEVLANSELPAFDAIELFNPTGSEVDVSGWYLTDDRRVPKKFRIPSGSRIAAGGHLVFDERAFNLIEASRFSLGSTGEEVFLFSADPAGNLTGYIDGFSFGASSSGVTFGRYENSAGRVSYPPQSRSTLGRENSGPFVGPVVFHELRYLAGPGQERFVEIKNTTDVAVPLFDPLHPTNTWRVAGIGFDFPPGITLPPRGLALITTADPGFVRTKYGVPGTVPIFASQSGGLSEGGELLELLRPDSLAAPTNSTTAPYVVVDQVRYAATAPWPNLIAMGGGSIQRTNIRSYGDEPSNWRAVAEPTPGFDEAGNRAPIVLAGTVPAVETNTFPVVVTLPGSVKDDGLPALPGRVTALWTVLSGPGRVSFDNPNFPSTAARFSAPGSYVLRLTAFDGEFTTSADLAVELKNVPQPVVLIPAGSTWRYFDTGTQPDASWKTAGFLDTSWSVGKARLGYGGDGEVTTVGFGPNAQTKFISVYFRSTFQITQINLISSLTLRLLRDDGAVVYLNGKEVVRDNMPAGDITSTTLSSGTVGNADEQTYFESSLDRTSLVVGLNTIAVEVHQSGATSSDLSFDLELTAMISPSSDGGGDSFVSFQNRHFTAAELGNATLSGPAADPDSDGASNVEEYIAGTSPRDGSSRLTLQANLQANPGAQPTMLLSFVSAEGRGYVIESSAVLDAPRWQPVAEFPTATRASELKANLPLPSITAASFYRIRVR